MGDRTDGPRRRPAASRLALAISILTGSVALLVVSQAQARSSDALVRVDDAKLVRHDDNAVVTARVVWNRAGIAENDMIVGDVRLVAVRGRAGRPKELASTTSQNLAGDPVQDVRFELTSAADLNAIQSGNRVVLTATQHAYSPSPDLRTPRSYVTVAGLQKGPLRRVGLHDCADRPIVARADLIDCDLVGASLARAQLGRAGARTDLLKADLAGADLRNADLSDVDLAGGRVNGADATGATIDGLSLAKADGVGFVAHDTKIASSDIHDARMINANFGGSTFEGTSLSRSRFDRADFGGATILGADMNVAQFDAANLRRATLTGDTLYFADLTDAKLGEASMDASPQALMWTLLCRTELPDRTTENRDCRGKGPQRRRGAPTPFVTVDATLHRGSERATIEGTVHWNAESIDADGMRVGEVRAVAVDSGSGLPTILAEKSGPISPTDASERIDFEITGKRKLDALHDGNRVVVTATQRPPHPDPPAAGDETTERSYVTVDQLQAGPGRGRVGSADCSDLPIGPQAGADALRFCDLVGAALADADLSKADLRMEDLTGADLRGADLSSTHLDGARLAGVRASGSRLDTATLIDVAAPALVIRSTTISGATFFASALRGADFDGSTITMTSFATAGLGGKSSFADATLNRVDIAYATLARGDLSHVRAKQTSLFLADLSDATLRDSKWGPDEEGRDPPRSAILCRTTQENGDISNRDCGH